MEEPATGFADEPRRTVDNKLVASAQHSRKVSPTSDSGLEKQRDRGDNLSTEDPRVALPCYRSFFDRLLKL